jgi:DNA-directed RNA polymerase specialized sigma24 family protein
MSPRAGWLLVNEILPRLRSAVPQVAHCVGAEDPEELIGDATLHAARILHSAESRGKTVSASSVAFYAIEHTRSGRRSCGNSASDVHGAATQFKGRSRLESMEQVVASNEECGGEIWELHDVLSNDAEDPATKAMRNLDWQSLIAQLSARNQAIIQFMIEGMQGPAIARKLGVCSSTIHHRKKSLAAKILEFMGVDILIEVRRSPRWKDDLMTSRERLTCKHERCH